jgi:hypothetical protein
MDKELLDLGPQPLAHVMDRLGLKPSDLVDASTEQLNFKMVSRACKGRRLTLRVKQKILRALCKASGKKYGIEDIFDY